MNAFEWEQEKGLEYLRRMRQELQQSVQEREKRIAQLERRLRPFIADIVLEQQAV